MQEDRRIQQAPIPESKINHNYVLFICIFVLKTLMYIVREKGPFLFLNKIEYYFNMNVHINNI